MAKMIQNTDNHTFNNFSNNLNCRQQDKLGKITMTINDFYRALDIVSGETNVTIRMNVPDPVTLSYSDAAKLVIVDCNAGTVKRLHEAGFSLFLRENMGLIVDKF